MDIALRAKYEEVREQYDRQLKDLQEPRASEVGVARLRKIAVSRQGRVLMTTIQQKLWADSVEVPICNCAVGSAWRRSAY